MNYLLSVVVPTKNRYTYLEKLVELVISFNSQEIELVIQDNSDSNEAFKDFITEKTEAYPWIKYYYENRYLTSVQNFDLAISRCTGEYVCFIGDDDGIVRNITHYVKWMKDNNVEALRSAHSVYFWNGKGRYKQYAIFEPTSKQIEWLSPVHELKKVLKRGCPDLGRIPVLYTGIIKRSVLDTIYNDLGTYFPGVSPDAANGTVLSFYIKRYAYINTPIVITGTSNETGGGIQKKRIVRIDEVPFLKEKDFLNWEGTLPFLWTGTLVWPMSIISALRAVHQHGLITNIDYDQIIANFYFMNRGYKEEAMKYVSNKFIFFSYYYGLRLKSFVERVVDKSIRICTRNTRFLKGYTFWDLRDIIQAEELYNDIDNKNQIKI